MKIKNKILSYFFLIVFSAISFYVFGVMFAIIFSSRGEGIRWGFIFGIFFGQILLSIYQKEIIIVAILKSVIHIFLVFVFNKYLFPNMIPDIQLNNWWIMFISSIIFSSEVSSFIIKVLITICRNNSNKD